MNFHFVISLIILHTYARGCTCIRRQLKETVLLGTNTWSVMRKQNIQAKRSIRCTQSVAKRRGQNKTFEASTASFPRKWTANRSAIFAFGVQSCWIHHGGVLKIDLYNFLKYSQFHTVAHNCHGKTKTLTAKTKYLTAKPKTSRQKQNTSRQNQTSR